MNSPEIPRRFILADVDLKANALQAYLLARCRHILRHEAANAVQGIHSGVSFIAKITDSPSRSPVSMTECISMLRHQVSGLQETLFSVFDYVSPPAGLAEALNVREVLSEVRRLLTSEAGTVNFDIDLAEDAAALARAHSLRSALLALLLDAMDAVGSGGEVDLTARREDGRIVFRCTSSAAICGADLLQALESSLAADDGKIERTVDADDGTLVTLSFPATTSAHRAAPASMPDSPTPSAPSGVSRVLILDDHRDAADSLGMLLELEGNEVAVTYDAAEALRAMDDYCPDVVLLDIAMPQMNGFEVARRVRSSCKHQPMLVVVTGYAASPIASGESDFDAQLIKPVDVAIAQSLIRNAVKRSPSC